MRYGSICSGIESASLAWHPLGLEPAWFSEIEHFPCAVLAHHYPHVANLGDMTTIARRVLQGDVEAPDILVGGTPCQAFSIAGMRAGLNDPRGQLTMSYVRLADATDFIRQRRREPEAIIVWENVPGVLSDKTNAFGCFLGALAGEDCELVPPGKRWTDAGCVYGPKRAIAWRVLDAQYFGLAQRRRRVFLVASARKGFDPASVLFESEGVRRDIAPSREAKEDIAGTIEASIARSRGAGQPTSILTASTGDISHCLNAGGMGRQDYETETETVIVQCVTGDVTHTLKADGHDGSEDGTGRGTPIIAFSCKDHGADAADAADDLAPTLRAMNHSGSHANAGGQMAVAYAIQAGALRENPNSGPDGVGVQADHAYTLEARAEVQAVAFHENQRNELSVSDVASTLKGRGGKPGQGYPAAMIGMAVRRLMPIECERLQGFPDNHTAVPYRNKPAADGPRYKAIGNSKAVPCIRWVGARIKTVIEQCNEVAA